MTDPVTVSITRIVDPANEEQMMAWLRAGQGLVGESHMEKRTGIEGWFDEPPSTDVQDLRPPPSSPPRWKQMCVIFLVFFPLSLATNYAAGAWLGGIPLPVRVLISVCLMTPIMTFLASPG